MARLKRCLAPRRLAPRRLAQDLTIDIELPLDAPFVELEMTWGTDTGIHVTIHRDDLRAIGRSRCGPPFHAMPGELVCLTIRALDLAGNRSQPSTRCTSVGDIAGDTTEILRPMRQFRTPIVETRSRRWFLDLLAVLAALFARVARNARERNTPST